MNLVVDGIIYTAQKHGGISRIFTEVLPRMCELEPSLNVSALIYPNTSLKNLPVHKRIQYNHIPDLEKFVRPYRIWRPYYPRLFQWAGRIISGNSRDKVWLSTYYTVPVAWKGLQVVIVHDFIHEKYRQTYWKDDLAIVDETIRKKMTAISRADLIICNSEATRQDLMAFYHTPIDKTVVIHLAQTPVFKVLNQLQIEKMNYILYVGKRNRYKGFDTLLRAFADWHNRKEFSLICAGGGDWTNLELQQIALYGLSNQVTVLPQIDDMQLCELYNQASAFVYPSQYEGFGIPLLEALACGCPVVASRIPSSVEVAQETPFYFSPGNPEDLIRALEFALSSGRSIAHQNVGLELARRYSWDKTAQNFLDVFRSMV